MSTASNTIALGAGTATQLTYNTQPSTTANSGAAFATQPVLLLRDGANNPVGSTLVTATITGSPAGASLVGTVTATTDVSGLATFSGLGLNALVGNYTLTFTSGAVTSVASNTIAVSAGAPTQLTYNTQPSTTANSGSAFATQPVLLLRDSGNNPIGTVVVTATITGSPAGASLVGTATATTNSSGLATFSGLGLSGLAGTYSLTFTAGSVTSAASNNIVLSPGAAAQLMITSQPVGGSNGAVLAAQPVVAIQDSQGNTVTTDNATQVTVTISSGAGGTLGGTLIVTAVSGIATFTNVSLTGTVGVNYVLQFTSSPALTAPNSNNVTVTAPAATQLAITTQPVGGASGALLATQPVVAIRDALGGTVTTDNTTQVSVAITSGAGGTLGGTQSATAVNGIATFTNLTLSGTVGVTYALQFTSNPALTAANANNVTVTAGAATHLGLTTQPAGGASGAALTTQPVVVIRDAQGNTVTTDNSTQVTVAISSGAGGTLGGTQTVSAVNGIATFADLTLAGTVGVNYVLQFTSNPALVVVNSSSVTVTAGAATELFITTQPVGGSTGAPLATQPIVTVRDAQGNIVLTDNTTQVTVAISSGIGGTLGGTLMVTVSGGVATFTNVTLTGVPLTNYVLQFTSNPALTPANSTNVQVTP